MLRTVCSEKIPRKEKTARTQPARKMLEDLYEKGQEMPRSAKDNYTHDDHYLLVTYALAHLKLKASSKNMERAQNLF